MKIELFKPTQQMCIRGRSGSVVFEFKAAITPRIPSTLTLGYAIIAAVGALFTDNLTGVLFVAGSAFGAMMQRVLDAALVTRRDHADVYLRDGKLVDSQGEPVLAAFDADAAPRVDLSERYDHEEK